MKFKIEKNIPVPRKTTCLKYPFREMNVGDSFIIYEDYTRTKMQMAGNAARNFCKKAGLNIKFCVSKENNKVRIFRLK